MGSTEQVVQAAALSYQLSMTFTMIKVVLCLLVVFSCTQGDDVPSSLLKILSMESTSDGAEFKYSYITEHGIKVQTTGTEGEGGQANMKGTYSYILPDGTPAEFEWYADEFGFHVDSSLLPVRPVFPFPAPWGPNAFKQILHAQNQRDKGLTYH